ncbi:prepilin-type N-terminal cleavage/methylation domain-containing protein [uncultured Planktosalinus sp.]|uniref:PulJ/GspJ family protein n=1 Tax=uncultured Planktosalinus sp. TaxID=1810935 RepID=UPI0030DB8F31
MEIKKAPSFTLTEMLIVLAISVIVVGLAFAVLQFVNKNIYDIQNNYSESTTTRLIEQQITVDFNKYHNIFYNEVADELVFKTPLDSITYNFKDDIVYRSSDTLFYGGYINELFMTGDPIQTGKVDALKIIFKDRKTPTSIFIYKDNDASFYLVENGN